MVVPIPNQVSIGIRRSSFFRCSTPPASVVFMLTFSGVTAPPLLGGGTSLSDFLGRDKGWKYRNANGSRIERMRPGKKSRRRHWSEMPGGAVSSSHCASCGRNRSGRAPQNRKSFFVRCIRGRSLRPLETSRDFSMAAGSLSRRNPM